MRFNHLARTFCSVALASVMLSGITCTPQQARAEGPQFDAEFLARKNQFGEQWAAQDKQVRQKLATLEEKHGKKPNIVFILADDIGYTELGSYGGGKVRGAPTPNLDRMADQGMRLLSFYAEPACTPTRASLMTGRHPVRIGMLGVLFPGPSTLELS